MLIIEEMPREHMERMNHKLYHKQAIKFRGFLINVILMIIVGLILCHTGCIGHMASKMNISAEILSSEMMAIMGLWKVFNVVLFLVPALAIWWERCCMHRHMNENHKRK